MQAKTKKVLTTNLTNHTNEIQPSPKDFCILRLAKISADQCSPLFSSFAIRFRPLQPKMRWTASSSPRIDVNPQAIRLRKFGMQVDENPITEGEP